MARTRLIVVGSLFCLLASCSVDPVPGDEDAGVLDGGSDAGVTDAGGVDAGNPDGGRVFLEACQQDAECESGLCISGFCSRPCVDHASCGAVNLRCGTLPNDAGTTWCLPRFGDLCRPCTSDAHCGLTHEGAAVEDRAACVRFTDAGAALGGFCGTECDATLACPTGYSCVEVAGAMAKQCVKDDPQCSCQPAWESLTTSCTVVNAFGSCSGARGCFGGVLTTCDAQTPAAETCNGFDDNCDGTIDEGGNALCSNGGLSCVTATCGGDAGCQTSIATDACVIDGGCFADAALDPANSCQHCVPATSQTVWTARVLAACDDGQPCTVGDACTAQAECVPTGPKDCSAQTDACNDGVCEAATGACLQQPARLTNSCDDQNACTGNGTCALQSDAGVCTGAVAIGDSYESNNTVLIPRVLADLSECGDSRSLTATINPGTDVDWYRFSIENSSPACSLGTSATLTSPAGRDYDLLMCVNMIGQSFTASCDSGSAVAAPLGLNGYVCCQSTQTASSDFVEIDWSCGGSICTSTTGTVYLRVTPKGGTQPAECSMGYSLTWADD